MDRSTGRRSFKAHFRMGDPATRLPRSPTAGPDPPREPPFALPEGLREASNVPHCTHASVATLPSRLAAHRPFATLRGRPPPGGAPCSSSTVAPSAAIAPGPRFRPRPVAAPGSVLSPLARRGLGGGLALRYDARSQRAGRSEHPGVLHRMETRRRHRSREPTEKRQRVHVHRVRSITERALQHDAHETLGPHTR